MQLSRDVWDIAVGYLTEKQMSSVIVVSELLLAAGVIVEALDL
jgi:hypothetical protein